MARFVLTQMRDRGLLAQGIRSPYKSIASSACDMSTLDAKEISSINGVWNTMVQARGQDHSYTVIDYVSDEVTGRESR